MAAPAIAFEELVSFAELKTLAGAEGPCVTIAMPLPNPLEVRTRLKNAVHGIERSLSASDRDRTIDELLEPIRNAAVNIGTKGVWAKAVVILRSPDVFRGYWLRGWRREIVTAEDRFRLRPVLAAVAREQRFHLLGLSQVNVRLFTSTMFRADEVKLTGAPRNLRRWMNTRRPDHVLDSRSTAGRSTGFMKGVMFGASTDREKHDEYLRHFFKEVDHGVHAAIRDDSAPLLVAGVEDELAIYREVNTYPHLYERALHGSPDAFRLPDLLERARDLVGQARSEPLRKAFAEMDRHPVSSDAREIPDMAAEGRIGDLLVAEDTEDERLDLAALEVLRHGGRVFAVKLAEIPGNAPAMAVLRH